ncbi:MAG: NAD(P)/FAD-dependent oxidoreductase [Armatimonadetes bacterium]|nr:NAD(P)/FAD-dependent oxidoreductase [Armatimonadota bacterium]
MKTQKFKVLVIGAGAAGLDVAARMTKHVLAAEIAIIEPAEYHYYQPLWTLVGGGDATKEQSHRSMSSLMPAGVKWIKERASELMPDENAVMTESGSRLEYDYLVLVPGLKIDFEAIKGLKEALENDPRVSTNYDFNLCEKTFEGVKNIKKGVAIFTHPSTPIKCGGAPQKIMYLAEHYWQKNGSRNDIEVCGYFAPGTIFGVPAYADALDKIVEKRDIHMHYRMDLIEVRHETGEAIFQNLDNPDHQEIVKYDFMHVTPKMFPPDFVANSPLAHQEGPSKGWCNVDINTLQSVNYPNVFALGDVAALPTSKTGAAIRKQAVVAEKNLVSQMGGTKPSEQYDGYTSCPLVTGYGRLIMAEFGYDNKLMPSFPLDPTKERWSMYMIKKHGLPILYWNFMLKGKA